MSLSAYVHIPFCTHKCEFCDFAAFAGLSHLEDEYCQIVCREIEQRDASSSAQRKLDSVFYGGGTPGLIEVSNLSLIHSQLTEKFGTSVDCEINLETTPHAITPEKVKGWREIGVNRLSIGVESFQDDELKAIGRDHTRAQAYDGISAALENGLDNISLDFMYGLPTQTVDSWKDTLHQLFELADRHPQICHFSSYSLHLANNSPLYSKFPKDSPQYPEDKSHEEMFLLLVQMAKEAGFQHYEVSNFCKPNHQSRHNLSYWNNSDYLAYGVSAHRYLGGVRSSNWRSIGVYMKDFLGDETSETIDTETRMREAIMLGLRLRSGLDLNNFEHDFGINLREKFKRQIERLLDGGFVEIVNERLRITDRGVLVSNSIISELF
ncbi:MAG: radical SAM family heme chaperone HemW [Cyanobacteria bacterium SZAS-4]|nr:radical SAM family heme chaperone HemW [Cyanobacteria bacterium SZAS-4]